MAILRANWNQERDYWANFEPFVADCLKSWPNGKAVKPDALRDALAERFSIPVVPINTAQMLRDRAFRSRLLTRNAITRSFHPNPAELDGLPDLQVESKSALASMEELCRRLVVFARDAYDLEWSQEAAEAALELFVEEFSVELAMARREGLEAEVEAQADERLLVVQGFARRAVERDQATLELLEAMVKGSMLANVLYFSGVGSWTPSFPHLVVYLDTTPVIRMLGLAPDALSKAAQEMLALIKEFGITPRIFEHTATEIQGVLDGVKHGLRRVRSGEAGLDQMGTVNREVVDHLISKGSGPADIEEIVADLDRRLLAMGIQSEERPDRPQRPDFDEARLDETLQEWIGYRFSGPREKDVDSLIGVHVLRDKQECRELTKTPALFVTANERLARASQAYFKADGLANSIPHCITDVSLTTQLWIRRPEKQPDLARTVLIAESYAALSPTPEMWERYLAEISRGRERGNLTDQQVKTLVYSISARERLLEVTHGDPDAVDEQTPFEVLKRHERELTRPAAERAEAAEEEARKARELADSAQRERDALRESAEAAKTRADAADERAAVLEKQLGDLAAWKQVAVRVLGALLSAVAALRQPSF